MPHEKAEATVGISLPRELGIVVAWGMVRFSSADLHPAFSPTRGRKACGCSCPGWYREPSGTVGRTTRCGKVKATAGSRVACEVDRGCARRVIRFGSADLLAMPRLERSRPASRH